MKISVITIVLNDAEHIEQTMLSVLNQTSFDSIEYIVIDGDSTDGTWEIVQRYSEKLSYACSEKDNGIYYAMNKGLSHATGDVVLFLNSGDWLENDHIIAKVINAYEKDTDILYGRVYRVHNEIKDGYVCMADVHMDLNEIYYDNVFCHQGMFIRRRLFDTIGFFDLQYRVFADYDWNLKAYNAGVKIKIISDVVANYRTGGLSGQTNVKSVTEKNSIVTKHLTGDEEFKRIMRRRWLKRDGRIFAKTMLKNEPLTLCEFFNINKQYYVWGIGYYGKLAVDMLDVVGQPIVSYIETEPTKQVFGGVRINRLEDVISDFTEDTMIIIGTVDYEDEVEDYMVQHGVQKQNYMKITDAFRWLCTKYYA